MALVEVITQNAAAEIPKVDDTEELILGLEHVVGAGSISGFNDVAWMDYYDKASRAAALADPNFQQILDRIGLPVEDPVEGIVRKPNIFPRLDTLASVMAARKGRGGFFHRVSHLDTRKYVASPARQDKHGVKLDLLRAISFDGSLLVDAMFNQGVPSELIDYREEPTFPAYRDVAIGGFLLSSTSRA